MDHSCVKKCKIICTQQIKLLNSREFDIKTKEEVNKVEYIPCFSIFTLRKYELRNFQQFLRQFLLKVSNLKYIDIIPFPA